MTRSVLAVCALAAHVSLAAADGALRGAARASGTNLTGTVRAEGRPQSVIDFCKACSCSSFECWDVCFECTGKPRPEQPAALVSSAAADDALRAAGRPQSVNDFCKTCTCSSFMCWDLCGLSCAAFASAAADAAQRGAANSLGANLTGMVRAEGRPQSVNDFCKTCTCSSFMCWDLCGLSCAALASLAAADDAQRGAANSLGANLTGMVRAEGRPASALESASGRQFQCLLGFTEMYCSPISGTILANSVTECGHYCAREAGKTNAIVTWIPQKTECSCCSRDFEYKQILGGDETLWTCY